MPWFYDFLTSVSRSRARSQPGLGRRALAATLSFVLVLGTVSPGIALAGEADSEQEGSAPPGALPGLEEGPELELGAGETGLEELPGSTVGNEGSEEGPPIETEPAQESELPAPAPEAMEPTAKAPPPAEGAAGTPSSEPEYGPAYEPAPASPPTRAVENQAIIAPEISPPSAPEQSAPEAAQDAPEPPPPASPSEAPESKPAPPAATATKPNGTLAGHPSYTVQAGDCLWSIAERLLPAGASVAEVEAEVARLWRLNAARIGTGDPNLIYAGTALRLH